MPRNYLLCSAVFVGSAVAATLARGPVPGGTIWVTERTPGNSTVAALDSATGELRGITPVGNVPIGITAPRGSQKVYSSDEGADRLSVIDKDTVQVIATIPMGAGSRPHHLMASRNGRYIYVGEYGSNKIGVVDTLRDEKLTDFTASDNPKAKTHAVWISKNGKDLYATNEGALPTDTGTFSKLDARTGTLIWEYPVGIRPSEVLVFDGIAYVSVRNEHVIRSYDVTGGLPVFLKQTDANFMPDTLSMTNDGETLIVGLRGSPARMAFIDTETMTTRYLGLPGALTGHQWLSRNGRFTFIALESPGQIGVVDNRLRSLVTTYPYPNGGTRPHGVFYEPPADEDDEDE
jgi:YVTN family beta-propeller protein